MKRYGLFSLGDLNYAVSLPLIRKIVQDAKSYQLPGLPRTVAAVMVDDSALVPVIALNAWFGGPACSSGASEYRVLVDTSCGTIALPAEINGKIVPERKGTLLHREEDQVLFVEAEFRFQETIYKILDMNFPAEEMKLVSSRINPDNVA